MGIDSRMSPRMEIDLKVSSAIPKTAKQSFGLAKGGRFEVTAFDISTLGIGIITGYFLPAGLKIALVVKGDIFGLKKMVRIKGEVRHCEYKQLNKYKVGIRFIGISKQHKDAIAKFIASHDKRKEPRLSLE
ncbi:MAG: PilZ domain-containing protein [Candidatus Omnitrophica bacterium]|nr:PilZ domain-containing protein [Candidatus Omnitrophota bacterium]